MSDDRNDLEAAAVPVEVEAAASDVISAGQHAWAGIKRNAVETCEMRRRVGEALIEGRKLHPSHQAFGKWCAENDLDMKPDLRADAMWLASNWPVIGASEDAANPTWIRKLHRTAETGAKSERTKATKKAAAVPFGAIRSALKPEHFKPEHAAAAENALSALDGVLEALRKVMAAMEGLTLPNQTR